MQTLTTMLATFQIFIINLIKELYFHHENFMKKILTIQIKLVYIDCFLKVHLTN